MALDLKLATLICHMFSPSLSQALSHKIAARTDLPQSVNLHYLRIYLHYLHFLTVTYNIRRRCKKMSLTPPSELENPLTYLHCNLHRQGLSSATLPQTRSTRKTSNTTTMPSHSQSHSVSHSSRAKPSSSAIGGFCRLNATQRRDRRSCDTAASRKGALECCTSRLVSPNPAIASSCKTFPV